MKPLTRWMRFVLRFVAVFNICAGLNMLLLYHETYKLIGMEKPAVSLFTQLTGILVALFGVGYYMVARNPVENRNVLLLGFWSKFLGSCLALFYVLSGKLPWTFMIIVFFADIIYLPPFYLILQRLKQVARSSDSAAGND